jgi:hypothetical protein
MRQIEGVRARVEAAGPLAELLATGWDAFTVILGTCQACEGQGPGLFAAFAFAAAAASRGRLRLASAPSFPIGDRGEASHDGCVTPDLENVASGLGGLAALLHGRLRETGLTAPTAGDRAACAEAATYAAQAAELLSRDG